MESSPSLVEGTRFYYGWVNVVVASVAMSATFPGRTYGLGLIKEPLRADLGISDLQFNLFNFWAIIIGAACVIPIGRLIDRWGSRFVLLCVSLALGISVLLMSRVHDEANLFLTLTMVRGLGQGALSVVAIALVSKWFKRRVGLAMGVFTILLGIGFIFPNFAVGAMVKDSGWRIAWEYVGYALIFGLAPIGWFFARRTPESMGLPPDEPIQETHSSVSMRLGQALRTPAFWVYAAAATIFNLVFSAMTLDNESLLIERGLDGEKAKALIMAVLFLSGLPVNFLFGWLSRTYSKGKLLAVGVGITGASLLYFPFVDTMSGATIYALLLGAAGGATTVIYFAIFGHTFGRGHIGAIQATVQVLSVFASATGPVVLALCRDYFGSSQPFFYCFAALSVALAVMSWAVRPPARDAFQESTP